MKQLINKSYLLSSLPQRCGNCTLLSLASTDDVTGMQLVMSWNVGGPGVNLCCYPPLTRQSIEVKAYSPTAYSPERWQIVNRRWSYIEPMELYCFNPAIVVIRVQVRGSLCNYQNNYVALIGLSIQQSNVMYKCCTLGVMMSFTRICPHTTHKYTQIHTSA